MAEQFQLTTPISGPSTASYRVARICLKRLPSHVISIDLVDNNGVDSHFLYEGDVARMLLNQLNTMNFTNNSFEKRVLERLVSDGLIPAGAVSGTPGD